MRAYGSGFQLGVSPVVLNLIIMNVLLFGLKSAMPSGVLDQWLGLFALQSPNFRPWQLLSYMFMHANLMHIFGNMFGLFMFGSSLERVWGPQRFLTYYLITGFGAAAMQLGVNSWEFHQHMAVLAQSGVTMQDIRALSVLPIDNDSVSASIAALMHRTGAGEADITRAVIDMIGPMIGASGSVFGVLLAFGMMFPNELVYWQMFIPIKAKYFVAIYGLLEFYYGVHQTTGDSVAHYAHLGGMLFGFFLVRYWKRTTIL